MTTHNLSRKNILRRVAALVGSAALLIAFLPPVRAEAPTLITYQGRLKASNIPQNGAFNMTFRIWNDLIGGVNTFTEIHSAANAVNVTNGLFAVQLGVLTPGGIPAAAVFSSSITYLEITVAGDTLFPRERITSSAYAIYAGTATYVIDGAITSSKLADGAVTTAKLADASVSSSKIAAGAITSGKIAANAVTSVELLDGAITSSKLADASVSSSKLAGPLQTWSRSGIDVILMNTGDRVGIGTASPGAKLEVVGDAKVTGNVLMGYIIRRLTCSSSGTDCYVACPAGTQILSGGCIATASVLKASYPSTNTTDSSNAIGTAPADNDLSAQSWSCRIDVSGTVFYAFAVCGRVAN